MQGQMPSFCSNCGELLEAGQKFCPNCGQPIDMVETADMYGGGQHVNVQPTPVNEVSDSQQTPAVQFKPQNGAVAASEYQAPVDDVASSEPAIVPPPVEYVAPRRSFIRRNLWWIILLGILTVITFVVIIVLIDAAASSSYYDYDYDYDYYY